MTNLQRIRKERGLSQRELAELSGVNLRMIQKYESGEKNINHAQVITVWKLAAALKIHNHMQLILQVDEEMYNAMSLTLYTGYTAQNGTN